MGVLRRAGAVVQERGEENQAIDVSIAAIKFYGFIFSAYPLLTFLFLKLQGGAD
jgi:hypothetical protein